MSTIQDMSIADRSPQTEQEYQKALTAEGIPWSIDPATGHTSIPYYGIGGNGAQPFDPNNPMITAMKAQQMQLQANAPAIQTLQGQQTSLKDAYSSLLQSVLGQGTAATNQATTAENNVLAQRGITNDSPLYGQQMSSALIPVTAQNQSAAAQVGMGSAQDINTLAGQIATLQTGNVPQALSAGLNFAQLPAQIALLNAQAKQANVIPIPGLGVYDLNAGRLINNTNSLGLSPSGRTIVGNF